MLAAFALCKGHARLILDLWLALALGAIRDKPLSLVEFVVMFSYCAHAPASGVSLLSKRQLYRHAVS